uniref:FCS-type domain-containing protein n=1 Tax=Hanusia phi TaxID=3032 RepID=A0A6T7NB18_9CRYP|mmetsp:Transcript_16821/g.38333  ORF Transcript_16821/g.38333 Transcript_16821/m.38333 type:complete len:284 (+) Transcript_16821:57-908(+)
MSKGILSAYLFLVWQCVSLADRQHSDQVTTSLPRREMSIYRRLTCPIPNCLEIDGRSKPETYSTNKCKLCGKDDVLSMTTNDKASSSLSEQRSDTSQLHHATIDFTETVNTPEPLQLSTISDGWPVANSTWKSKYSEGQEDQGVRRIRQMPMLHSDVSSSADYANESPSDGSYTEIQDAEPKFSTAPVKTKMLRLTPDSLDLAVKIVKHCQACGKQCNGTWIMGYDAVHCSDFCLKLTESMLEKEDEMSMQNEIRAGIPTAGDEEYDPEHEDYISKTTAFKAA